ncbi:asparagine synthase-related protein [Streptomyces sp. NPDC090994]|uniref:asparagine synthase-related protein n=1 Tax=Streptomyces sp. NPDC090994 TaxID=3365969 RepID=UPI00381E4EF3
MTSSTSGPGEPVGDFTGVRHCGSGRVRVVTDGQVRLAVLGDCGAGEHELAGMLAAVAAGRWEAVARWPGSYWVLAENRRHRFVCGDLAGVRALFYTQHPVRGAVWATQPRLLQQQRLAADVPFLLARLVAGEQHWPQRTVYADVRQVPGGYGLLLADGVPPRLVDVTGIEPADGLRRGAGRLGQELTEAVQRRVRAAGGMVSADLSGGLDSSTAVVLAAARGPVHAVTYTDGYTSAEDASYAARVAAHTQATHTVACGGEEELPFSRGPQNVEACEPVFAMANWAMDARYLAPVAGLPRHLTGHGGDVVLDASAAGWVRLAQTGRRREAHRQVVAFARLRNTAPGPYWQAVREAARLGRCGALEQAAAVLERGMPDRDTAARGWAWCRLGAAASWPTEEGRGHVAALLREAAADGRQPEAADVFDDWAALRAMGTSARGFAPYAQALGIHPAYPYLDNQVVRAAFAVPALARRGRQSYKPLLGAALPQLPDWLTSRRSKGSFTAQRIAGLARHREQLDELMAVGPLAGSGLVDTAAVRAALTRAARGESAAGIAELHQYIVTSWWLSGRPARQEVAAC